MADVVNEAVGVVCPGEAAGMDPPLAFALPSSKIDGLSTT